MSSGALLTLLQRILELEEILGWLFRCRVDRVVLCRRHCFWVAHVGEQSAQRSDRAVALFIEANAVRFQDGARFALQSRQLGVVLSQRLGLGADGVPPIDDGLQDVDKWIDADAIASHLQLEILTCCHSRLAKRKILLIELIEIADAQRHEKLGAIHALLKIRPIARDDEFLLPDLCPALPQAQRHGKIHAQRPIGRSAERRRDVVARGHRSFEAVPAIKRNAVHARQRQIAGLQQELLVRFEN